MLYDKKKKTAVQTTVFQNAHSKNAHKMSFLIQTILSAPELHRIVPQGLAGFTAGRESHPAPKTVSVFNLRL